jgi:hypothetical protein
MCDDTFPRLLGIFAAWRLEAYALGIAIVYIVLICFGYHSGVWLVGSRGVPLYSDFTTAWTAGYQALHGHAAVVYDSPEFVKLQKAVVEPRSYYYPNWPYPPTYFLLLAPLGAIDYVSAYLTYEFVTLIAFVLMLYFIVRRQPVIALVLASPFTLWNFVFGQSGFLTAALIGAALLALESRPALAGVFIGCLTYKPQFGILFPIALVAAREWRAIGSAAATVVFLAGVSATAFGIEPWIQFPREFLAQGSLNLVVGPGIGRDPGPWGILQTVYGLVRRLHGSAVLAWLSQGLTTFGTAGIAWLVWRSRVRYALKAATLSLGALIASPYACAYDLAAIAVPIAFFAKDQIERGLLRGEQATLLGIFVISFCAFVTVGRAPVGPPILFALLYLILRRAVGRGAAELGDDRKLASRPAMTTTGAR